MSGAVWVDGAPATTYGALNVHDLPAVAAVMHTTETSGMPGYSNGDVAPHETYDPLSRTFYRHAPWDRYVGTLKGHTDGGHGNCKAIQLEIIAYSDKAVADGSASRLWIGDLGPDHYQDLAEWFARVVDETDVGTDVTPTPAGGWLYGTSSPLRMSTSEWESFNGLTAHGAVPLNTHWDTGVLDLETIRDLAVDDPTEYRTIVNVPDEDWARAVADWGIDVSKIINIADDHQDDWLQPINSGREWTIIQRYDSYVQRCIREAIAELRDELT